MSMELWQRGCERLAAELPEQQFNTWIRPLAPATPAAGVVELKDVVAVQVPNRFKLDWIRSQYAGRIESVLADLAGHPVRLELTLAPRPEPGFAALWAPWRALPGLPLSPWHARVLAFDTGPFEQGRVTPQSFP